MSEITRQFEKSGWEYSPAPEKTKVVFQDKYKLFIGGKFVSPKSRSWFSTINPSNEKKLADVASASKGDVDAAVRAAAGLQEEAPAAARRLRARPLVHLAGDGRRGSAGGRRAGPSQAEPVAL